jgi:Flp pilus assembly protein TadD
MNMKNTSPKIEVSVLTLSVLTIVVVLVFTYWNITSNGFHLDDKSNIVNNAAVRLDEFSLNGFVNAAESGLISQRPIAYLTFALDWLRGRGNPAQFLQTNLSIHVLNAILLLVLLRTILKTFFGADALPATLASLVATLFWALHPIQVQSVSYIVQRMTLLAATFTLLALIAYLQARQSGRAGWYLVLGLSLVLAALSKQIAWLLPVYFVLIELSLLGDRPFWQTWRGRLLFLGPLIFLLYLTVDLYTNGVVWDFIAKRYEERDFSLSERLLTQPRVILFHLSQVLWPHIGTFSIEHDIVVSSTLTRPSTTWLSLVALAIWLTLGVMALAIGRVRKPAFFLLWPLAALSLESSFVPLEMIFEHRMYVPMIGLAGLFALGLVHIWQFDQRATRAVSVVASVLILGYLASVSSNYLLVWRDERTLYAHAVKFAPSSARAWELYGNGLERAKEDSAAIAAYSKSLQLERENWRVLIDRGALLLRAGEVELAEKDFDRAIEISPYVAAPFANRGVIYFRRGEFSKALSDLDMAIKIRPYFVQALHNRALLKLRLRDYEGARRDIDRAHYYAPSDAAVMRLRREIYGGGGP